MWKSFYKSLKNCPNRCQRVSKPSVQETGPFPACSSYVPVSMCGYDSVPPAKLLLQNSTGLASDFLLLSAFDVILLDPSPCRLTSPCRSQLGTSREFL